MKIIKLTLHRFKCLHLLANETFELTPTSDHVVLRGTSGIGKSKILSELSPLPAVMREFEEGGYKTIHIQKDNHDFILTSSGKNAGQHSFMMDGTELNQGGTLTVQYQLVEQYFNYTKDIHAIMIGHKRFTTMNAGERRKWFAEMSNSDNEFVMKLWDALRAGQRGDMGALKNNTKKIAEYTAQLAPDEQMKETNEMITYLEEAINRAIVFKSRCQLRDDLTYVNDPRYKEQVSKLESTLVKRHNELVVMLNDLHKKQKDYNIKDLPTMIDKCEVTLGNYQDQRTTLLNTLATLQEEEQKLTHAGLDNENDITQYLSQTHTRLSQLYQQCTKETLVSMKETLNQHVNDTNSITWLERAQRGLTEDKLRDIDHHLIHHTPFTEGYNEIVKRYRDLTYAYQTNLSKLQQLEARHQDVTDHLTQLNNSPEHECPKCKFSFKDKTIEEKLQRHKETLVSLSEKIARGKKRVEEQALEIEDLKAQISNFDYLIATLIDAGDLTSVLFSLYVSKQYQAPRSQQIDDLDKNAKSYLGKLQWVRDRLAYLADYIQLTAQEQALLKDLEVGKIKTSPEYIALITKIENIEKDVDNINHRIDELSTRCKAMKQLSNEVARLVDEVDHTDKMINTFMMYYEEKDKRAYLNALDKIISTLTERLNLEKKKVEHQTGLDYLMKHLQNNQAEIEISIERHQALMDVLNPKDGLIAKSMVGFIRKYVSDMNKIIKQVWSYRLHIEISENETFTKDYKFPVEVGDSHTGYSPDVFFTSRGQSEIIDLAFRLMMMKNLKLNHYPLYADELGSNINVQHRINLYNLLKRYYDEHRLSQLFIITHLDDIESMMAKAETIILS